MREKKGFTLVELLAVVVLLSIIMMISIPVVTKWIDKSKDESKEGVKKTLVMATQSYAQSNTEILPKIIGQRITVTANDLKESNYIKDDLKNADKNSCMDSYVEIYKSNKNNYEYEAHVLCDGDVEEIDSKNNPSISIAFVGTEVSGNIDSVSASAFKITIDGGKKGGGHL